MANKPERTIYEIIRDESYSSDDPKKIMKKALNEVKKFVNLDENYPTIEERRTALGGTKVHAISVQKGGVGKTTISSNLAWTLSNLGYKVLLIDSDPQGSLTELCNIHVTDKLPGLQDIYIYMLNNGRKVSWELIKNVIVRPKYVKAVQEGMKWVKKPVEFGFDFIPAAITLSDLDIYLPTRGDGGEFMYYMIDEIKEHADYDFILIDCMPGLGVLTYNAIAASVDGIIVPVNLELMTIVGARNLINVVRQVQNMFGDTIANSVYHKGICGIVKNQYNARRKVTRKYEDILHAFFPIVAFGTDIPNKAICDTAHDMGRLYADMDKEVGRIFEDLANEIVMMDIYRRTEDRIIMVPEISESLEEALQNMQDGSESI